MPCARMPLEISILFSGDTERSRQGLPCAGILPSPAPKSRQDLGTAAPFCPSLSLFVLYLFIAALPGWGAAFPMMSPIPSSRSRLMSPVPGSRTAAGPDGTGTSPSCPAWVPKAGMLLLHLSAPSAPWFSQIKAGNGGERLRSRVLLLPAPDKNNRERLRKGRENPRPQPRRLVTKTSKSR